MPRRNDSDLRLPSSRRAAMRCLPGMVPRCALRASTDAATTRVSNRARPDRSRSRTFRAAILAVACAITVLPVGGSQASDREALAGRDGAITRIGKVGGARVAATTREFPGRGTEADLVLNGSFSAQPDPLAFWTTAPGAFATWVADGANGSQGAVNLRFLPPVSSGASKRGAVYYTGLTQCIALPRPGRYLLRGYGRVPSTASPSSFPGLRWSLRYDAPDCTGPLDGNGGVNLPRSTSWTASSVGSIAISAAAWTANTTLAIDVEVGDSSTASVEPVEAFLDEISLVEGPLFADGFED